MKKIIALVFTLACLLGMVGCAVRTNEVSDMGDVSHEELNSIAQSEIEAIAIAQCKVNYDYIGIEFDDAEKVWKVAFWENDAVIAAQTITIDSAGNILSILYAE